MVVVPEGGGQLPVGIAEVLLLALDDEIERIAVAVGRGVAPVQVDYTSRLGRGLTCMSDRRTLGPASNMQPPRERL